MPIVAESAALLVTPTVSISGLLLADLVAGASRRVAFGVERVAALCPPCAVRAVRARPTSLPGLAVIAAWR